MSFLKYAERNPNGAQRALERAGNRLSKLKARGICCHGWIQGQPGFADGPIKCLDCGAQFANSAEHKAARDEAWNS